MEDQSEKSFMTLFTPSELELWGQWQTVLSQASYELLRHLQGYLRDAKKVFAALRALNAATDVIRELEKTEGLNGFGAAEKMLDETDTGRFLDKIAAKVPLIDIAADNKTGDDGVRHGRLTHRIQWYIIVHSLLSDPIGQGLLTRAGCKNVADAYALSAKREFRKNATSGKLVAPWTTMVDRPVILFQDRLYLPDATIPENLGALIGAGNFTKILDAEDGLWSNGLYKSTLFDHPFFRNLESASRRRTELLKERKKKAKLRAKEREALYEKQKAELFRAALDPGSTYEDSLRYRRFAASGIPEI